MDIEYIKKLAAILSGCGLTRLEVTDGDTRIVLEKDPQDASPAPSGIENSQPEINPEEVDFNNLIEVKSPLVGVFYSSPSPDDPPFVNIGDKVNKGDVLCIMESMKVMNEITADQDGEIVDVCVKSGDIAEYGQVLFKMR